MTSYPDMPVHGLLERGAKDFPANTPTIFIGGKMTYAKLLENVNRFATALAALGVNKGNRVGLMELAAAGMTGHAA